MQRTWRISLLFILQGRTVSATEDDIRAAAAPLLEDTTDTLGFGGLTGARVHLPDITEDEDGHDGTEDQLPQYSAADKKVRTDKLMYLGRYYVNKISINVS